MNEPAVICPVCSCPCRREVDIMLLQGWSPDDVCETLPEAPRRPQEIKAHQIAGHMDIDMEALVCVAVQIAQDVRANDREMKEMAKRAALADSKVVEGYHGANRPERHNLFPILQFRDSVNFRLRYIEVIAKLAGIIGGKKGDKEGDTNYITQNNLNLAIAGDPEMPLRVMRAQADKLGFEVRKKPQPKPKQIDPADATAK